MGDGYLRVPEEGTGASGAEVIVNCELPYGYWEPNPDLNKYS